MPTGVFPTLGYFGRTKEGGPTRFTRKLPSGGYRTVLENATITEQITIKLTNISSTERDEIETFFNARMASATITGFEFYIYDSDEVLTVDLTGVSTTGRKTAIFVPEPSKLKWTHVNTCRHSTDIPIWFVNG